MNEIVITIKVNGKLVDHTALFVDVETAKRIDKVRTAILAEVGEMNFARIQNHLEGE